MKRQTLVLLLGVASQLAACASTQSDVDGPVLRPAVDVPAHFLVSAGGASREPQAGEGCRNPLVDPRDGRRLTLERSARGLGDYSVVVGAYGLAAGELLRVDCATGVPVGIVR